MMTERQIQQVRTSFCHIQPVASDVTALFYIRLVELDPSQQTRVFTSLSEQADQLAGLLPALVDCAECPARMREIAQSLGPRTCKRVRSMHYPVAGKALLWALEKSLGSAFNTELRTAWASAYESLVATIECGIGPSDETPPAGVRFA